jgi:hypothetical protein
MPGNALAAPPTPWVRLIAGHRDPQNGTGSMIHACKEHLDEVDETYFEHLRAALAIALRLAFASVACILHALIPGICTKSASRRIAAIGNMLEARSKAFERLGREPTAISAPTAMPIDMEGS